MRVATAGVAQFTKIRTVAIGKMLIWEGDQPRTVSAAQAVSTGSRMLPCIITQQSGAYQYRADRTAAQSFKSNNQQSMLKTDIIGNLGANAQVKQINGKDYVSFDIAHTERDTTVWVSALWRGNGGNLLQYLTKGTSVFVRGNLSAGTYTTRSGEVRVSLSVMVSEINLISSTRGQEERSYLDGARQLSQQQQPAPPAPPVGAAPPAGAPPANDDDLPF